MEKKRILYEMVEMFIVNSDSTHGIPRTFIENYLDKLGYKIERRAIYKNIQSINAYGLLNIKMKSDFMYYRMETLSHEDVIDVFSDMKACGCNEKTISIVKNYLMKEMSKYQKDEIVKNLPDFFEKNKKHSEITNEIHEK